MPTQALVAPDGPLIIPSILTDDILLSIIVPTFLESENIGQFLLALCEALDPDLRGCYEIVVVDDDSPDGTLEIAAETAKGHPQIRLVSRKERRGLASAVIRGWQVAKGRALATINADFQHPPVLMMEMWRMSQTADLVVASRYCGGGGFGDWSMLRRFLAGGARWFGRIFLPEVFGRVTDPLSGCFLFRRSLLTGVELDPIGFKSLVEVLVRGRAVTIAECPYQMHARNRGSSKANGARLLDYIVQLCRLRKALRKPNP
jgi:dolichol-phosphate mannosyltransferase